MEDINCYATFPMGEKFNSPYFIGTVWLNMLTKNISCPIANVTFEPGCRNNWHTHPGGQLLLITDGKGWYQEEGKPAKALQAGDVVEIPANVKHWHGAAKDSWLAHLAVEISPEKGSVQWLEPVDDYVYDKL